MHVLGTVLAVFSILLGGASFFLSTQLLDIRSQWVKQVEQSEKAWIQAKDQHTEKRKQLAKLQSDYDRLMLGWDTYFNNRQVAGDAASGAFTAPVGPPELIELKDSTGKVVPKLVYAFQPKGNGPDYEYVGEFLTTRVAAGQSSFQPNWRVRPNELARMRFGPNWRIRTQIPTANKKYYDNRNVQFSTSLELLARKQSDLTNLNQKLLPEIDKVLANREGDIAGFKELENKRGTLPDETIDGTLNTIVTEEKLRNAALAEANLLRHQLYDTIQQFEKLTRQNSKAAAAMTPVGAPAGKLTQR